MLGSVHTDPKLHFLMFAEFCLSINIFRDKYSLYLVTQQFDSFEIGLAVFDTCTSHNGLIFRAMTHKTATGTLFP